MAVRKTTKKTPPKKAPVKKAETKFKDVVEVKIIQAHPKMAYFAGHRYLVTVKEAKKLKDLGMIK